jgi:hypothetical protein
MTDRKKSKENLFGLNPARAKVGTRQSDYRAANFDYFGLISDR